ncbi:TPA: hypothetical protein DEP58_00195 [Patescibacteria group bacterium]|nr:MAG: hypothetical protein UU98_C0002G0057 [Parcubacteria group bacterium GW2011_GWD2_42_14]HCC04708.1 hypothetical protein [Patescibacteria group bacterium]
MPYTSVWPNFEIGGFAYNSGLKILNALEKSCVQIEPVVREILESPNYTACKNVHKLNLETITPGRLGLKASDAYQGTFFNAAERSGLRLIHSDTPLILRVRYKKQSENRFLYAGMKTINHKGTAYTFVLTVSKTTVWIRAEPLKCDSLLKPDAEFLFQR